MRALLPIPHGAKRKVKPGRELFLCKAQLLAQRAHRRDTARASKRCLRRRRSVGVRERGAMTLVLAHGVESAPIRLWRLLRSELKSRDIFSFHAAPLLLQI